MPDADAAERQRAVENARRSVGPRLLIMGAQIGSSLLAARLLGAVELGRFAVALGVVGVLGLFAGAQLHQVLQRHRGEWPGSTVWRASVLLGTGGGVGMLGVAAVFSVFDPSVAKVLIAFSPAVASRPFLMSAAGALAAERRLGSTLIVQSSPVFGRLLGLVAIASLDLPAIATTLALAESAGAVLAASIWFRPGGFTGGGHAPVRRLVAAGSPLVGAAAGATVVQRADTILLEPLVGAAETGRYFITSRLMEVASQAYAAALGIFVRDASSGDPGLEFRGHWTLLRRLLVGPVLLGGIFVPEVLPVAFGLDFAVNPAIAAILSVAVAIQVGSGPAGLVLISLGDGRGLARGSVLAAVANIGTNLALIPYVGAVGAAVAMVCSNLLNNVYLIIRAQRSGVQLICREDLPYLVGLASASGCVLLSVSRPDLIMLAAGVVLASLIFGEMLCRESSLGA